MTGADCNAGLAARALGIVDYRQIVYHCNRAVRALLCAHAAGYTADLARVHNFLALALGVAGNIDGSGGGYAFNDVLGAGIDAGTAADAGIGIDLCKFALYSNCIFGADGFAVAASETAVFADLVSAEQTAICRTGGVAAVSECVNGIFCAAVALYNCNRAFFLFEFNAEESCNLRLLFGGGNVAVGEVSLAAGKFSGETAATGASAAAAVCACKVFKDFGDFFVHIYLEYFADYEYESDNYNCNAGENSGNYADSFPRFGIDFT